jgi:hypothetical protein
VVYHFLTKYHSLLIYLRDSILKETKSFNSNGQYYDHPVCLKLYFES